MSVSDAIDGDIAEFLDSMIEVTDEFRTAELRAFLVNEGHADAHVTSALQQWQARYFRPASDGWETFRLTVAGDAAVRNLRKRIG